MKRLFILLIAVLMVLSPIMAQSQQVCDRTAPINAGIGATVTVIVANTGPTVICGFLLSSPTANAGATINNVQLSTGTGGTASTSTPILFMPANGNIVFTGTMNAVIGSAVTLTAGTGMITGLMSYRVSN